MSATRLSFSYPEELKESLKKLAKRENRTLSSYVQNLLAKHIEEKTINKTKKTRKKAKR